MNYLIFTQGQAIMILLKLIPIVFIFLIVLRIILSTMKKFIKS